MKNEDQKEQGEYKDKKSWLEWVVFGLGLSFTLLIVGYLSYKAAAQEYGPPELYVTYVPDPGRFEPFRYRLALHNEGIETAKSITVEILLEKDGQKLEEATFEVDYCPQGSLREGWVSFSHDPASADSIRTRIVGYEKP